MPDFTRHPLLREQAVEKRKYQENIAETCLKGNTLVVIPTGLGKTIVSALVAAERMSLFPDGKCVVLAPTKPLVLQHAKIFGSVLNIDPEQLSVQTGETPPEKRMESDSRLVFLTPQVLENDILGKRTFLDDVVLLVFDEAHRAVGKYSYVYIASAYHSKAKSPLILGLTASPGSTREIIEEVKRNLFVRFVTARTEFSPDVKPYVKSVEIEWRPVELSPALKQIKAGLEFFVREGAKSLAKVGFEFANKSNHLTFREYSEGIKKIREEMSKHPSSPPHLRQAISSLASMKRVSYAIELLETQGLATLTGYFEKLENLGQRSGTSSAVKRILTDGSVREAINLTYVYSHKGIEHPKLEELKRTVKKKIDTGARRVIVFTHYRDTAKKLVEDLTNLDGVRVCRIVGQADKLGDTGLSQKEQASVLEDFRQGISNVLVATQVAEEGIDISSSDSVIFYDNVPSAIRFIQRRGRTGRQSPGKVSILITRNTRDEAYYWIARRKEKMMREVVREMEAESEGTQSEQQKNLESFIHTKSNQQIQEPKPIVFVDNREGPSPVIKELLRIGADVKMTNLQVADYIISDKIAVERKTELDFASSILDKRLFQQTKELSSTYTHPLLILEGENPYTASGLTPQAIRGAILSLIFDFRLPVLLCKNSTETALTLYSIAKSEQLERKAHIDIRGEKKPSTVAEQQEFLVAGLPHVELTLAKRLLATFGNAAGVFDAQEEKLREVKGVGNIIARNIRNVLTNNYEEKNGT